MIFSIRNQMETQHRVQIEDVNRMLCEEPQKILLQTEQYYNNQIQKAVEAVLRENHRGILIAGPSGSGKTTTALKLTQQLSECGHTAHVISLDNFFNGRGGYPMLPDGTEDFDSVYALNIPLIHRTITDLFERGCAQMPRFDFVTGMRTDCAYELKLEESDVVIIEGIHALNPLLMPQIYRNSVYELYVTVQTEFVQGNQTILTGQNLRLIRRMIRDYLFRDYIPQKTLIVWPNVCRGEAQNIQPFLSDADQVIDTLHPYEVGVYREILRHITDAEGYPAENKLLDNIKNQIQVFSVFALSDIPADSMIREFVGE